jgi:hypothetical protein
MRGHACVVLVLGASLMVGAAPAAAQIPGCGGVALKMDVWQSGGDLRVSGYAQINRNIDGCAIKLRVEAWVDGALPGSVATNESWGPSVSVSFARNVPRYGTYVGRSKNWAILGGFAWNFLGQSSDETQVRPPDDPPDDDDPDLASGDPSCDGCVSPLLFDRDGNGFHLTSVEDGVLFDIDADGVADRVAWTTTDSEDAWLAYDRNGNGTIDDGSELFGNHSPAYADPALKELTAANGFEALRFMQMPDYGRAVADEAFDARDDAFTRLLLWIDRNHNGLSEPDELQPAASEGLVSIGLAYKERKRRDQHGNEFRLKGFSAWRTERGKVRESVVWDVWLQVAR